MAFRSKETMKKILKQVDNVARGVRGALKKSLLDNKVIMDCANEGYLLATIFSLPTKLTTTTSEERIS